MRLIITIAASVSLLGCTTTLFSSGFMPTQAARAAVPPDHVQLVFSGHVDKPYRELGVANIVVGPRMVTWTSSPPPKPGAVTDELRAIGARNGCDAMLVSPTTFSTYSAHTTAVCIVYQPDVAAAAP
jgi:hypothetical protein